MSQLQLHAYRAEWLSLLLLAANGSRGPLQQPDDLGQAHGLLLHSRHLTVGVAYRVWGSLGSDGCHSGPGGGAGG